LRLETALLRQTADHIIATLDHKGVWFGRSIIALVQPHGSRYRIEYFLGLLNSRYFKSLYHSLVQESGRVFAQVKLSKLKQLPIRTVDFSDRADRARHDRITVLVQQIIEQKKRQVSMKAPDAKTRLLRQIDTTDRQIDLLVYELYGLNDEEIAAIEDGE
jgi:hypothetical protein